MEAKTRVIGELLEEVGKLEAERAESEKEVRSLGNKVEELNGAVRTLGEVAARVSVGTARVQRPIREGCKEEQAVATRKQYAK